MPLKDTQRERDTRRLPIDRVGIKDLRYPIRVRDKGDSLQSTIATVQLTVDLPHHFKGTHMSRFIEVLSKHEGEVTSRTLPDILHDLRERLNAEEAHIEVAFTYFVTKKAPVSGAEAKVGCDCILIGKSNSGADDLTLRVTVPVTTLCPCSKEISDYGAHNQRGNVTIEVRPKRKGSGCELILIEDLVDIAEKSGSAPVYALLKRTDERHVTMQAYDNPVFVEDVVRNAAALLRADARIDSFTVRAVNQESIHDHNAFAVISGKAVD